MDGALAPARRGMTLLRAKRTMEAMIEACRRFVDVPMVKDEEALGRDPAQAGITAAPVIVRLQIRRPGATCAA
ncbi:MAG TPA: hypothetical protein VKT26_11020 [Acetobacteraceae bacterium]|nr:hypothetical protein [Acetobacteraceae bacterium]